MPRPEGTPDAEGEDPAPSGETLEFDRIRRDLGGLLRKGSEIDWQESRRWSTEVLSAYADKCDKSRKLTARIEGVKYFVGGDEHLLFRVDDEPGRVFKITHGDNFGCRSRFSPFDPELTGRHFHGVGNADPLFYLQRWLLLNSISRFQTRFEGIVLPLKPSWVPSFCISQPDIYLENPARTQIRKSFAPSGFLELCEDAFFCPTNQVLLTDAAPRNVRVVDGLPFPLDAIAEVASPTVIQWFENGCRRAMPPNSAVES